MPEKIRELRLVIGTEEINFLLNTGRWTIFSLDWNDETPEAKMIRCK